MQVLEGNNKSIHSFHSRTYLNSLDTNTRRWCSFKVFTIKPVYTHTHLVAPFFKNTNTIANIECSKPQTQFLLNFSMMRTLLGLVAFFMFFVSREITLIQEMFINLRASLHERILDMAFPLLLLVSFVTGIYFLIVIPFPSGWMRWMAILMLLFVTPFGCFACVYGLDGT